MEDPKIQFVLGAKLQKYDQTSQIRILKIKQTNEIQKQRIEEQT